MGVRPSHCAFVRAEAARTFRRSAGSLGSAPFSMCVQILRGCNCQALLASFECFYSKYRWQVARDFLPIFTFIQAREYRTTVCAEIDARRITLVTSHCLTEHSEEAALLWQTLTHRLPGMATVARPPD